MILIWCDDSSDESYTDAALPNARQFIGVPFALGVPLTGRFPDATKLVLRSTLEPLDFFRAGPMPVVSERLWAILEQFRVGAEFFPVEVISKNGSILNSRWFCMNVLPAIDCLDWENSVYKLDRDFATELERVSLVEDASDSHALFRIARAIPSLICASENLSNAIIASGCTGVVFNKPEDWTNPRNPH
jgi:hypothetical protein